METKFTASAERVYNEDGAHIATVWALVPLEERREGESWLDMRKRLEPLRHKCQQDTFDLAKLFAAAPDLYEALSQCFDYPAEVFDTPEDRPFTMTVTGRHLQMVRAALAKATGEQP